VSAASIEGLRALCGGPRDGALLRFALASALASAGDPDAAIAELDHALAFDPQYSAAWKLLGNARAAAGDPAAAIVAFERGIAAANGRGDVQAAREMSVLLRRLQRT
jgi:predicted Zn-dependent protease